jgi:phosphotriesterase-related protein
MDPDFGTAERIMGSGLLGKAITVLGPIPAESLGITLPHEHILQDSSFCFVEPQDPKEKELAHQPLSLQNLSWVLRHPFNHLDNLKLDNEERAVQELLSFKEAGGRTVVEQSVRGLSGNPEALGRISRTTGLNIIMATGYYVSNTYPESLSRLSAAEVSEELVRDITEGIGKTGIRAGILKAAIGGMGLPPGSVVEEGDRKVLDACAMAQRRTGAALEVHNMRKVLAAEAVNILKDAGADLRRVVMLHADRWGIDPLVFPKLLAAGCYLEFDGFGTAELGLIPGPGLDYQMNDIQRCDLVLKVIAMGYLEQLLISHDVWIKTRAESFGGAGYAHILRNVVPLMRHKGITEEQIQTILVDNPRRVLALKGI